MVSPTQHATFLGLDIDTRDCTLSLGKEKLAQLSDRRHWFKNKARASTKQQLQSLERSLKWACKFVRGGRFFSPWNPGQYHLAEAGAAQGDTVTRFKRDLSWWLAYFYMYNGRRYVLTMRNGSSREKRPNSSCAAVFLRVLLRTQMCSVQCH